MKKIILKKLNLEKNESINNNDNIISEPTDNIDLKEETLNKVDVQETINISQESFIPPEPEVIEKEQIQEEVKIDPFTEAEVLNASANIKEEKINDTEPQEKQQEGIIKRFSAKALFGNSSKKKEDINRVRTSSYLMLKIIKMMVI